MEAPAFSHLFHTWISMRVTSAESIQSHSGSMSVSKTERRAKPFTREREKYLAKLPVFHWTQQGTTQGDLFCGFFSNEVRPWSILARLRVCDHMPGLWCSWAAVWCAGPEAKSLQYQSFTSCAISSNFLEQYGWPLQLEVFTHGVKWSWALRGWVRGSHHFGLPKDLGPQGPGSLQQDFSAERAPQGGKSPPEGGEAAKGGLGFLFTLP